MTFYRKTRWCFSIWRKSSSVCPMWTILFGKKMVLSCKKCPKFYTPEFSLNHHLNKDLHRWKKYFPTLVVINKIKELFVAKDKKGKLEFLIIIDVIGFFVTFYKALSKSRQFTTSFIHGVYNTYGVRSL